jgi:polyhydroxybutyrate depolymerase
MRLTLIALPSDAAAQVVRLTHDEVKRRYIVYVPASYATHPDRHYPVVLHFHGGGMTAAEQMLYTRMNVTADKNDFIVAYPQGVSQDWNVGFGQSYADGTDDVGFTEAVLDHLGVTYRIDTARIYATGLSRGGFFVHRLAAELSHRLAAVASVGAPLPVPVRDGERLRGPQRPIGVMQVHGTADEVVMYDGKPGHYLSAAGTQARWVERNGMARTAAIEEQIDIDTTDATRVTVRRVEQAGMAVTLVTVHDGGHTWPGADPFNVGLPIGRTTRDIDVNEMMWRFFAAHRRH